MRARRDADPGGERAKCAAFREKHKEAHLGRRRTAYHREDPDARSLAASAYYQANKERIKAAARARYCADPEAAKAEKRSYYQANRDSCLARSRAYAEANPEVVRRAKNAYDERNRESLRAKGRARDLANPEKRAAQRAAYRKKYPHKVNAYGARYRADKAQRTKLHNPEVLALVEAEMFELAATLTRETGVPHEVDHTVPLRGRTVCGLHNEHNLQVSTKAANRSKSNRWWPDMP